MKKYIGVWIDHRKAWIVTLAEGKAGIATLESDSEGHFRLSGGARTRKTPFGPQDVVKERQVDDRRAHQLHQYYQRVVAAVAGADRIYILGPGEARVELKKHLEMTKALAAKIAAVEPSDKVTEHQLVAKVKKFFKIDE
jgi:hypothetical protein